MTWWAVAVVLASLVGAGWAVVLLKLAATRRTHRARHRKGRP